MYICILVYTYIHIYTHTHTLVYTYIYVYIVFEGYIGPTIGLMKGDTRSLDCSSHTYHH